MTEAGITIRHDESVQQFLADIDGSPSGAAMRYRKLDDDTLDYYSTYTPEALRGKGIAGQIVTTALDYALDKGFRVVPTCPYVARLIERDERYRPLVG